MSFFFYYYYSSFLLVIALTNDPFCFLTAYSESFPLLAVYVPRCFLLYTPLPWQHEAQILALELVYISLPPRGSDDTDRFIDRYIPSL